MRIIRLLGSYKRSFHQQFALPRAGGGVRINEPFADQAGKDKAGDGDGGRKAHGPAGKDDRKDYGTGCLVRRIRKIIRAYGDCFDGGRSGVKGFGGRDGGGGGDGGDHRYSGIGQVCLGAVVPKDAGNSVRGAAEERLAPGIEDVFAAEGQEDWVGRS